MQALFFVACLFVIVATHTQASFTFIKTKRLVLQPKYIGTVYVECHSSSIIYLITCKKFYTQYIGKAVQKLNNTKIPWMTHASPLESNIRST